jgi:hypothetical protein
LGCESRKEVRAGRGASIQANAGNNWYFGLWAAGTLGLVGADAESYARAVMIVHIDIPGSDNNLENITVDFKSKGILYLDREIDRVMDEFKRRAFAELKAGVDGNSKE